MFKKLQLTLHLLLLYGLLAVFLLAVGGYSLFVIYQYDETLHSVDREQFPLFNVVTEITRHQLDQTLRFNEVLFFARVGDREKFEVSNEKFIQAGKRFGDEILEGRNVAQKGMEMARSEARLKEIDTIKTLLKGIEKSHGDYEHLGALLIRGIYQYDFLSKTETIAVGDHASAEEEANKHMAFLKGNLSALEDEVRRMEGGIKDVMERVKQLPQSLAVDSRHQRDWVFQVVLPAVGFALVMGFLLVLVIIQVQKERERNKNSLTSQSLLLLSDALTHLQQAFQQLDPASQQVEQIIAGERGRVASIMTEVQNLVLQADNALSLAEQMRSLVGEEHQALEQAGLLIQQLNKGADLLLESATESGRTIRHLRDLTSQINLLATNASAEAFRSDATRSFAVFTDEIKELARANVLVAETLVNRAEDSIVHIRTDQLHTVQTRRRFENVTEVSRKEGALFARIAELLTHHAALSRLVQGGIGEMHTVLQGSGAVLEQVKSSRQTVQTQLKGAQEALGGWPSGSAS
ncbi:MAG: hypothetical protein HQL90_07205 [Magnetococcales bacterium]|nr:hypothetical protein [Magnetococcales bacterium]